MGINSNRPPQPPESLLSDVVHDSDKSWRRWARTGVLTFFALIILSAAIGVFDLGGRREADLGEASVEVDYPVTTRAGLDLRITLEIVGSESLPETVRVEIDQDYLEMFEDLLFVPEPLDQMALSEEVMRLEYEVPDGSDYFRMSVEGRAADQWEPRTGGKIRIFASDGSETEIPITTWRMP